jgi:hypothetical protein
MGTRERELVPAHVRGIDSGIDEVVMLADGKGNQLRLELGNAGGAPQVEDLAFLVPS